MRYIAFLRGINVSGQKLIKMDMLKRHFEMPGFENIKTYIQSGNVLFDAPETEDTQLRQQIETRLAQELGYQVPAIVRSIDEIRKVIEQNPFEKIERGGKWNIYVTFMSGQPDETLHQAIEAYKTGQEELKIINREVYLLLESYGNTRLTNALIEKKLSVTATTRNWGTVNKILEM